MSATHSLQEPVHGSCDADAWFTIAVVGLWILM